MEIFLLTATILVLIGLGFVLPSLLGWGQKDGGDRGQLNAHIHRQRLQMLEAQYRDGRMDAQEFAQARGEIEMAVLSDVADQRFSGEQAFEQGNTPALRANLDRGGEATHTPTIPGSSLSRFLTKKAGLSPTRPMIITAVLVALALPATSLGLYFQWGSPEGISWPAQGAARNQDASASFSGSPSELPPIKDMVEKLAARLQQDPDDPQGWLMLGRSYRVIGQTDEANAAFAEAYERQPDSPEILLAYAESLAVANQGAMAGRPAELIHLALQIDPGSSSGLWLAGVAAYQQEQYGKAAEHWERLQKGGNISDDEQKMLAEILAEAKEADAKGKASTPP